MVALRLNPRILEVAHLRQTLMILKSADEVDVAVAVRVATHFVISFKIVLVEMVT